MDTSPSYLLRMAFLGGGVDPYYNSHFINDICLEIMANTNTERLVVQAFSFGIGIAIDDHCIYICYSSNDR
jgi:hypothetical protein